MNSKKFAFLFSLLIVGISASAAPFYTQAPYYDLQQKTVVWNTQPELLPKAQLQEIHQAMSLIKKKQHHEALAILTPLIEEIDNLRKRDTRSAYASYTESALMLLYLMNGANQQQESYLLAHEWVEPLVMRAYIHIELGDMQAAKQDLDSALQLAPFDPHILNERAYLFCQEKNWQAAEADFKQALEMAALFNDNKKIGIALQTRALRGLGYIAVERKQWKEAEEFYQQALKIDSNDRISIAELKYIQSNKPQ